VILIIRLEQVVKKLKGRVAVITGAASGIGRALATELAREGCDLALADVNAQGLGNVVTSLSTSRSRVSSHCLDVSDREAVYQFAKDVAQKHGKANILVNNAGVALVDRVEDMSYEDFQWLMDINFWGVVYGTKAFLPLLKASGEGHIVNMSSVFGLIGAPTQSAYNAAKFAVRGFTEALCEELELEACGVNASCVHPGGVKTDIVKSSRMGANVTSSPDERKKMVETFDKIAATQPVDAAKVIIRGIKKNKRRILIGADARLIDGVQRLFPRSYSKLLVLGARSRRLGQGIYESDSKSE